MANYIRVPLKDTTANGSPRYGLVNVSDAYDVAASGGDEHIRIYTSLPADTTDVIVNIIEYYANGGGTAVVTAQDIANLKDLIIKANQEPGSNPIFELEGAATAAAADLEDYEVDDFVQSSLTPL
tara:strand:- start:831 stop:1205 length:375 start_codon:yes stop_codon:yes gene_type:complete